MWQEEFVPCYVQLSRNVPKTEKPAKFLIRSRSGAGRDVNPRPHIQLPNVTHVSFQSATSMGVEFVSCRLRRGGLHHMLHTYVSVTPLPTSLKPQMRGILRFADRASWYISG